MRLSRTGVDGKLSTCRRVSSLRHEISRPAISTGRKLVRPWTSDARYPGNRLPSSVVLAAAKRAIIAVSILRSDSWAVLPRTFPVFGSRLTFLLEAAISGVIARCSLSSIAKRSRGQHQQLAALEARRWRHPARPSSTDGPRIRSAAWP
jgi:hypothetical protein